VKIEMESSRRGLIAGTELAPKTPERAEKEETPEYFGSLTSLLFRGF
jgi:hypothetical protein